MLAKPLGIPLAQPRRLLDGDLAGAQGALHGSANLLGKCALVILHVAQHVGDLVAFMRALGSGQLVTTTTLEAMTDLGENTSYGLGVQIDDRPGVGRCFGHGGYAFGSTAQMYHCPEAGVTISAFYGADGTRVLGAHLDILDRLLLAAG